ncbi:MraY family glycosyltransferase [Chamaesiphon sp. OTE_75_metabat_556]|uniref:glycosyltransferase family 4 protein n=1 Tax=Chamaesiphon sp. OTE_75_metabat_556 TaxID=2964692 RepID=UPI00286CD21D|nr:MraY family glycosyltransferase [Chamaesiphon sp. OTE_75_metabat_556]
MNSIGVADPQGRGWLSVVLTFMFAWIVTYLFIPKVRTFALKVGWADEPNARRLHQEPRPNAGGLAIYAGVIAAIILAGCLAPIVIAKVQVAILAILLGGSVLVLVGFIDDQFGGLPALFRLLVQVLTALLLVVCGIQIHIVYFGAPIDGILSIVATVLWIVGITNAVNLMDGIDGLAGGVSFITAMSLLAASAQFEVRAAATLISAGVGGAALGFLRHNYHPSRIFMGDAGSYFLGYVLAATSILGGAKVTTVTSLIPTVLLFLVPVVDTSQVIIKRLLAGQNPLSTPGKDHLHHRLLQQGFSQRHSAVILWGVTLAGGMIAMRMQGIRQMAIVVTAIGIALLLVMTVWLRLRAIVNTPDKPTLDSQDKP